MDECFNPEMSRLAETYDRLDAAERAKLDAHLEDCAFCRRKKGFIRLVSMASEIARGTSPSTHPSPDTLLAYLEIGENKLQPNESSALEEHLERCPKCKELLGLVKGLAEESKAADIPSKEGVEIDTAAEYADRLRPLFFDTEDGPGKMPGVPPWKNLVLKNH